MTETVVQSGAVNMVIPCLHARKHPDIPTSTAAPGQVHQKGKPLNKTQE